MITLIGMGSGTPESLTAQGLAALQNAGLILGAKRRLEQLPQGCTEHRKALYQPEDVLAALAADPEVDAALVYSGDTGFYSGAGKLLPLLRVMGYSVRVLPGLSSVQLLAAAVGRPWQDWKLVSAHGRACDPVAECMEGKPTFFLTGGSESPATLCAQLAAEGYRELVLTGIEISSWGRELKDGSSLIDLIEAVCQAALACRIRLGSLEPRTITDEFCRRAAVLPNLCPHFHLSLQSGCDATLKRMNRKYDTARYLESEELLNRWFDRPAGTTDLITGFPEETEEEFGETLAFIEKCGFAAMHIFPYSIRPGTKAAAMAQVDMSVREERAARAAAVAERMHQGYLARCVGKTFPVLFEQDRGEGSVGHAPNYMPVTVGMKGLHNTVQNVRITAVDGDGLRGEPEET